MECVEKDGNNLILRATLTKNNNDKVIQDTSDTSNNDIDYSNKSNSSDPMVQEDTHQSDDTDVMVVDEVSNNAVCISPQCGNLSITSGNHILNREWDS